MFSNILLQFKYSDEEVISVFNTFSKLLKPLTTLDINDKIGMIDYTFTENNNFESFVGISKIRWKMYNDKASLTQSISRWWNNQKRVNIMENLIIIFSVYQNFIEYIKTQSNNNSFLDILEKINTLNESITNGINNLKLSYHDDKIIIDSLNSITNAINS